MSKITCDIVKDIMPLCVDGVCSENTKQMVEDHIKECTACKNLWESYSSPSITDEIKSSNEKEFKELAKTVRKKNMRKTILTAFGAVCASIAAVFILGLCVLGLFSFGEKEKYRTIDTADYGIHEGHIAGEKQDLFSGLYIFPERISENAGEVTFYYSCEGAGLDNAYQQFLKCTYSEEEYKAEIARLKNIKCEIPSRKGPVINAVEYSDTKFSAPAYITAFASHDTYEYALCYDDDKTIVYVFLQAIENKDVVFGKEYLPLAYQDGKPLLEDDNNSMKNTNIYYNYEGNGVYRNFKD